MAPIYNTPQTNDTKPTRLGDVKNKLYGLFRFLLGRVGFSRKLKRWAGIPPETHSKKTSSNGSGTRIIQGYLIQYFPPVNLPESFGMDPIIIHPHKAESKEEYKKKIEDFIKSHPKIKQAGSGWSAKIRFTCKPPS